MRVPLEEKNDEKGNPFEVLDGSLLRLLFSRFFLTSMASETDKQDYQLLCHVRETRLAFLPSHTVGVASVAEPPR